MYRTTGPVPVGGTRALQSVAAPVRSDSAALEPAPPQSERAAIARLGVAKLSTGRDLLGRLERVRLYIESHLDRTITLGELAPIASLSAFHLARYFKRAFGTAPIAYHRLLRLARASALIASGVPVSDAAERVGYSDAVALSHAFRRQFGRSPRQWAKGGR